MTTENLKEELENITWEYVAVDSDLFKYRCASAAEKTSYQLYDENNKLIQEFPSAKECKDYVSDAEDFLEEDTSGWNRVTIKNDLGEEKALEILDMTLKDIRKQFKAEQYKYYVTGDDWYRHKLATILKYKGNRSGLEKPKHLEVVTKALSDKYEATTIDKYECDDGISVIVYKGFKEGKKILGVTTDKDLLNTPGYWYNFKRDELVFISEKEADYNFLRQLLTGDKSVDNILGLPDVSLEFREKYGLSKRKGVGKKTAEKILEGCKTRYDMFERVREAYKSFYGNKFTYESWDGITMTKTFDEILNENAELLWMQRTKGKLWSDERSYFER